MNEKKEVKRMLKKARKYFKLRRKCKKVEILKGEIFSILESLGLTSYKNATVWIELYSHQGEHPYSSWVYKRFIRKLDNGNIIPNKVSKR